MIYELRSYHISPGRMADQFRRFDELLPRLFNRHRIKSVGSWIAPSGVCGPSFVYLMAFEDFAHRESSWSGFYSDEEWWHVRAETNAGSELVESFDLTFLKPSPIWPSSHPPVPSGPHEIVVQRVWVGSRSTVNEFFSNVWLPFFHKAGASTLGVFDVLTGSTLPAVALFLAWPNSKIRDDAWRTARIDATMADALAGRRNIDGKSALAQRDVTLLYPRSSAPIDPSLGRPPA
ncbi:NIPSNAP family protein [Paraburkholderia sp. LEh10]|uniref:NIPSNAP family protein n=1 Tax=Paraburkholderia sp. LEh10 TaxID=2821353 RepID=UPI001AEA4FFA|nr:NIPSNAP family protein [Paraburkholderia sp. LEh10]MBP0590470.1 NIPSNAP family protein [Paraburkholderia sp. LEh10]